MARLRIAGVVLITLLFSAYSQPAQSAPAPAAQTFTLQLGG